MNAEIHVDRRGRANLSVLGPETKGRMYKARRDEHGVVYLEPARLVPVAALGVES